MPGENPFHEGELKANKWRAKRARGESNGAMIDNKIMSGALNSFAREADRQQPRRARTPLGIAAVWKISRAGRSQDAGDCDRSGRERCR